MHNNETGTKEKKMWTKDKAEQLFILTAFQCHCFYSYQKKMHLMLNIRSIIDIFQTIKFLWFPKCEKYYMEYFKGCM